MPLALLAPADMRLPRSLTGREERSGRRHHPLRPSARSELSEEGGPERSEQERRAWEPPSPSTPLATFSPPFSCYTTRTHRTGRQVQT